MNFIKKKHTDLSFNDKKMRINSRKGRGPESILYKSTWPLICVIRILGLAPYEFKGEELVPSNKYMIFSFLWLIVFTYTFFWAIVSQMANMYRDDMRLPTAITELCKFILNYVVVVIDIIMALCTSKKLTNIWNRIQNYDEVIQNLGYGRNEKKTFAWVLALLFFNLCIWTLISVFGMIGFSEPWLKNVTYMLIYIGSAATVTKFAGITMLLAQRFSQLNSIVQTTVVFAPRWKTIGSTINYQLIGYLHDDLMVITENLNSIFFWSVLLWLTNLSTHSISSSFYALSWLLDQGSFTPSVYFSPIYCLSSWITSFAFQIFMLCYACHHASYEANSMSAMMLEKRKWFYTYNRKMDVETLFHLANRPLQFSAAGFFYVDLQLFTTIMSVMTTYLCILLQID
ncbi:gustatory receptor 68a-like [Chelonus insularis]|uniref:gustatory receptor 68a-like n=1 Tax=Chelonus insularis TaxID=460826 RepID=UPI00158D5CC7|nr:gustatory receptor 68a-like [Chelonus insularis]